MKKIRLILYTIIIDACVIAYVAQAQQFTGGGVTSKNEEILKEYSSKKTGFICIRSDDTPRIDLDWIKLLNKWGIRYTACVNVPLWESAEIFLLKTIQELGHELCDHTPFHSTFCSDVPDIYMTYFEPYIGNGITTVMAPYPYRKGNFTTLLNFEYIVKADYMEHRIGGVMQYKLVGGTNIIEGDFSIAPNGFLWVYIDNVDGEKIGWLPLIPESRTDTQVKVNTIFTTDETINLYAVVGDVYNVTLSENATYCLLLAGQCWFNYFGLKKPKFWAQPGGSMPFVDRSFLSKALLKLGMLGGEAEQVQLEQHKATYNQWSPFPTVNYNWEGGFLHFDYCDGSDEWLAKAKALIADHVAKRNIRTLATHFTYSNFPGATVDEKRKNYLDWFDRLFSWIHENNIPTLTLSERNYLLDHTIPNRHADIFPELFLDRAERGHPDGYTITNSNVQWTENGLPISKNKSLDIQGNGNIFTIENLGALEKGKNELVFYAKGNKGAKINVKTTVGMEEPSYHPQPYPETNDTFTLTENKWQKFKLQFNIPSTMNYINIHFEAIDNNGMLNISAISLKGK